MERANSARRSAANVTAFWIVLGRVELGFLLQLVVLSNIRSLEQTGHNGASG
jgi:hypothetical protein